MADGKLLNEEAGAILEIAEALGVPARHAYGIMIGAAQVVGFQVDFHMKDLTKKVRNQLVESVKALSGVE